MLCYRCGSHVPDGTEACGTCGQKFALGLKPGPIAGFGTGTRRHRIAVENSPYKVGDVLAGRFEIKENVGAGPVGWVFKCLDREIDVDVALKVISPRFLQQPEERKALVRELRNVRKLSHANIVRVYEDGEDNDRVFFSMQHLEGLTLRRIWDLRRQKGQLFSLREVEPILSQIAQALDYAHREMAHGDLKPDNVIVLPDLLKVTDFGLANALPRAPFMAAQKTGGVHRYLAPEFLHGERIDPRFDVFSLGVILGEMLAGAPFEQGFDLVARNPQVSANVDAVFRKATAFKPQERYATTGELALALADAAGVKAPRSPTRDAAQVVPARPLSPAAPVAGAFSRVLTPPVVKLPAPRSSDIAVRDQTQDLSEELHEELVAPAPVLPPPAVTPGPKPAPQVVPLSEVVTPVKVEPVAPAKPPPPRATEPPPRVEKKPEAPETSAKSNGYGDQRRDGKAGRNGRDQRPATPPADPKAGKSLPPPPKAPEPKVEAKVRSDAKAKEPAWSGGAPPPPPKAAAPAPAPAPRGTDRNAKIAAVVLVIIIAVASGVLVMRDNEKRKARREEPAKLEPLVVDAEPVIAPVAEPSAGDAGLPAVVVAEAVREPVVEPVKVAVAEPVKTAAQLRAEKLAADKAAKQEAKALAAREKAEKLAADAAAKEEARREAQLAEDEGRKVRQAEALANLEKAAADKAASDKLLAERAAAERVASEKAEKAAREAAAAQKAAADRVLAEKAAAEKSAADKAASEKTALEAAASVGKNCPSGMRFIAGGSFKFGAPDSDDLKNFGDLDLEDAETAGYCVDIYESPNRAKIRPTTGVTFKQASDSCRASKKRLCREEEWEHACKGPGNARFPYGKAFDADACNTEDGDGTARDATFSGGFTKCVSGYGVYDMAGNVAEWTDALFEEGGSERVAKGGAADRPDFATRCAARTKKGPAAKEKLLGFRCCADPK